MGLAARKVKQRIGNDPRNLAWSENAAKFGHTYLSKLGWDPAKGLGATGDGRTTNIAVAQKLDQLGIGAGRRNPDGSVDKDSIAWKQQNEFEMMLARLNGGAGTSANTGGAVAAGGFVSGPTAPEQTSWSASAEADTTAEPEGSGSSSDQKEEKKKRKHDKLVEGESSTTPTTPVSESVEAPSRPASAPPRRFAHQRARLLNSKRIAGRSAAEIAEVLGVSQSQPSTPGSITTVNTPSHTPGTLTPISDDLIKASSTSVSDYFKRKMEEKLKGKTASTSTPVSTQPITPATQDEVDERPRFGLGSSRSIVDLSTTREEDDAPPQRTGLGGLGFRSATAASAFASPSFASSSSTTLDSTKVAEPINPDSADSNESGEEAEKKEETKEERRARRAAKKARKEEKKLRKETRAADALVTSASTPTSYSPSIPQSPLPSAGGQEKVEDERKKKRRKVEAEDGEDKEDGGETEEQRVKREKKEKKKEEKKKRKEGLP